MNKTPHDPFLLTLPAPVMPKIMYCGIFHRNLMKNPFFLSATMNAWGQEQHKYIFPQTIPPHILLRTLAKEMKYL